MRARRLSASLEERLMDKVEKQPDGCWLWRGAVKDTGYGVLQRGRRGQGLVRAHRASYEIHVGSVPPGFELCHSCDVRTCVNPAHLFVGTRADNMRDASAKGRLRGCHDHQTRGHHGQFVRAS